MATWHREGLHERVAAKGWVAVAFGVLCFIAGLSTPYPVGASVGLGGFIVVPVDPAQAIPTSAAPILATAPAIDSTSDSVGATVAQFRVDEGGNATYSVPIQGPLGTAGMTPKLALTYNSRQAGGVMGPGWAIQGASQITRCRQTRENGDFMSGTTPLDGNPAPVNFTPSDRFCLDGVRLLLTAGTSYGANNSVYSPESDPTTQVTASVTTAAAGLDTFAVQRKDGSTSTYGNTVASPNARITATLPGTGQTVSVSWNLARVQDTVGNYIDYLYTVNPSGGLFPFSAVEFVLSQVNYTGHATSPISSPYASIAFSYTTLATPYVRLGYQAGIAFLQTQQLAHVTVSDASHTSNPTLRYYTLSYQTSASGSTFQQVSQIKECRDSGQTVCFPATQFTWSAANYALVSDTAQTQSGPDFTNLVGYKVGDVDGDGRLDFVWAKNGDSQCPAGVSRIYVSFLDRTASNQMTLVTPSQGAVCAPIDLTNNDQAWYLVDYDGDGRADLMIGGAAGSTWAIYKSQGRPSAGAAVFGTTNLLAGLTTPITVPTGITAAGILADLNGDGLPDFIYPVTPTQGSDFSTVEARLIVRQSDGSFAFSDPYAVTVNYTDNTCIPSAGHVVNCDFNFFDNDTLHRSAIAADVNGDGRVDLTFIILQQTDHAGGAVPPPSPPQPSFNPLLGTPGQSSIATPNTVTNKFYWYQFTANGTSFPTGYAIPVVNLQQQWSGLMYGSGGTLPTSTSNFYVTDLNNDGLADILYQDPTDSSGKTYQAMLNTGTGYHAPIAVTASPATVRRRLCN